MRHYCTLFDSAYLAKGLALHESLLRHSSEPFTLHILACDVDTFWILAEMNLKNVELISLESFESVLKLEPVKESRSRTEYLWTLASCLMEYLLPWHESITYLDADVFFFSDPKVIYEEIGTKSIGIVPHRFNEREARRLAINGQFNVGVVYARNGGAGLTCVKRWAAQCREWCFSRNESGKFGDQAYLDSWPKDYPGEVCIIENLGVNLGPWAIANYEVSEWMTFDASDSAGPVQCKHSVMVIGKENADHLVCYHFHEFQDPQYLTGWKLRYTDCQLIYGPYCYAWTEANRRIAATKAQLETRRQELVERGA